MAALHFFLSFLRTVTLGATVKNFDASTKSTFLTTRWVGIWSMKMMLIPSFNIVYRLIFFTIFLIINNEVH